VRDMDSVRARWERFFAPRSLAVVGASQDPSRIGGRPIAYSLKAGFAGRIYPINPKYDRIQGLKAWPSLAAVPEPVDVVVVAVGQSQVEQVIREGAGKVGGYVVADQGAVLLGPNCLGFIAADAGAYPTFTSGFEDVEPVRGGGVAIVTQSGAFGAYLLRLATERGIGASNWVSTGNEAGLTVADLIAYYAEDPGTRIICAYLEGVRDGPRFLEALERVDRAGKLLIVVKVGRTERGAQAARSHTGSLVGSDAAFDAALRGHRAVRAESVREMLELAEAAAIGGVPRGRRYGIVTVSGGAGILMADAALDAGLELPEMPPAVTEPVLARVPFAAPYNPVDITAQTINEPDLLASTLRAMVEHVDLDALAVFLSHVIAAPSLADTLVDAFRAVRERSDLPLHLVGFAPEAVRRRYRELNVLLVEDPAAAVALVAKLAVVADATGPSATTSGGEDPGSPATGEEWAVKAWLRDLGLPVPAGRRVARPEDATEAAAAVGFPVAVKLQGEGLLHKTEHGAVRLGLTGPEAVAEAAEALWALGERLGLKNLSLLIEAMAPPGEELLVSVRRDPVFGPLLIFGLGGIWTEVLRDVRTELASASEKRLAEGLRALRGAGVLLGARGGPSYDLDALAQFLGRVARVGAGLLSRDPDATELELNPVRVSVDGIRILDAVLYRR
jgi:acyl-CoA synthetase (NDP forming)